MASPVIQHIVTLPDMLTCWPWKRIINRHYENCDNASNEWIESFKLYSPSSQNLFRKCKFGLLGSLFYPTLDFDGCKIGCDLMNFFFFIDDYTDTLDAQTLDKCVSTIMDVLRNPHEPRPEGEWIGGRVAQSFWLNVIKSATSSAQSHFIREFDEYLRAVHEQAVDRSNDYIRDVESYFVIRRKSIGAKPSFAIAGLYLDLPDWVLNHPVICRLTDIAADLIALENDMCSYKKEYESGDCAHNIVTVVMNQYGLGIHAAFNYVSDINYKLELEFLTEWKNIPTVAGPLNLVIVTYCDAVAALVRGNEAWHFESERYFGDQSFEVQKTRKVIIKADNQMGNAESEI